MGRKASPKLRVYTVYLAMHSGDWRKTLGDLGLTESEHWKNLILASEDEARVIELLRLGGRSAESYLLDKDGCVVHSCLSPTTLLPILQHAIATGETCSQVGRREVTP